MKNKTFVLLTSLTITTLVLGGLVFSGIASANYVRTTDPFIQSLILGDIAAARRSLFVPPGSDISLFSDEKLKAIGDALKASLGERIEVRFDRSQKVVSTNSNEATPEGTTRVYFDLVSNGKYLEVETLVNDQTQKVQYLNFAQNPSAVPNTIPLFLLTIFFLSIPVLNVLAITKIRSKYEKGRVWRYLTVLLLNLPTITYFAVGSININLLANQMFFGFSINLSGFSQMSVSIGLPLGSIFWILLLRRKQQLSMQEKATNIGKVETEITWDCPKCHDINSNSTFTCQNCGYSLK